MRWPAKSVFQRSNAFELPKWGGLLMAAALVATALPVQAAAPTVAELGAGIDASVAAFMQAENVPGLAFALVDRTSVIKIGSYGKANLESGAPVTATTRFGIGSITKSMTALALLEAADRGLFEPRAPIARYVPEFRPQTRWRAITGYDLLTHTSGLPDETSYGRAQVALASALSTVYAPGAHWWYSNLGYVVLGTALERIEDRPWVQIVTDRVFAPLGMTESEPAYTQENRARAATGYDYAFDDRPSPPGHPLAPVGWIEADDPDGFVLSTAGDMANYARFLIGDGTFDGTRVLSPQSFALFTHAVVDAGGPDLPGLYVRYGYGLAEETLDGHRVIGHTGGTNQFTACLEADVDEGVAAVALTNHGAMGPRPCAVVEYALRAARAQRDARALPAALTIEPPVPVPNAFEYAKTFRAVNGRAVTFVERGAALLLRESSGAEHRAYNRGGDSFFVDVPQFALSTIDFFRDDHGHVVEFFYLNDWYRTDAYRGPAGDDAPANLAALAGHYRLYEDSLNVRILIRHGKLWLDGSGPMWPAANGTYGVGDRWSPERYRFDTFAGGVAQRLIISGVPLVRTFTP
jgi:CubicO group peptidase (beta-lactamase class C family)